MKRVLSWLQNIQLRHVLTVFLVSLTFLVSTAFDKYGNELQAQAEPITPEARAYKVNGGDNEGAMKAERIKENAEKSAKILADEGKQVTDRAAESTQESGNNLFDSIRKKLNLDEPIDPGTKQAVEQLKETASEVIEAPQKALKDATK